MTHPYLIFTERRAMISPIRRRTGQIVLPQSLVRVAVIAFLTGCSSSDLDLTPVSGVLLRGGAPLQGIRVNSFPAKGPIATGTTDASGEFVLKTSGEQGALPGLHVLILSPPRGDVGMPGPNEAFAGPILNEKAGISRELQIRTESPLTYTLNSDEPREFIIDVESSSLQEAE